MRRIRRSPRTAGSSCSRDRPHLVDARSVCAANASTPIYGTTATPTPRRCRRATARHAADDRCRPSTQCVVVRPRAPFAEKHLSWSPAGHTDGSQVAFVTDATNLLPTTVAGVGDVRWRHRRGGSVVGTTPASHRQPGDGNDSRSSHATRCCLTTGRVVAFDSVSRSRHGDRSLIGRHVVAITSRPASRCAADFDTVLVGWEARSSTCRCSTTGQARSVPPTSRARLPTSRSLAARAGAASSSQPWCVHRLPGAKPTEPYVFAGTPDRLRSGRTSRSR